MAVVPRDIESCFSKRRFCKDSMSPPRSAWRKAGAFHPKAAADTAAGLAYY